MGQVVAVVSAKDGTAEKPPIWSDLAVARRLHCKLPGQLFAGYQPLEVKRVAGVHPYDEVKCSECGCKNAVVCAHDTRPRKHSKPK